MIRREDAARVHTVLDTELAVAATVAPVAERALAGHTIAGRYELLALVGAGGMGAVYRAHDRELDELVALKVIKAELARQPVMVDRFRHEVKLARRVTHVNIARTFELGNADGVVYCTMELVEGESLHQRLQRQGRLAVVDATAIAGELCDGLVAAHAAGVIHRDIKPDNVLLAHDGRVVLADFGVAAVAAGEHTGELTGTPTYMAPEQARGEALTPAADVYAVGVLLYEMVTGMRAFTGDLADILTAKQDITHLEVPQELVPQDLARVIAQATARDLSARIETAAELRRMLGPWVHLSLGPTGPRHRTEPGDPHTSHTPRDPLAELRTVLVLPPAGDDARLHLAAGVHEELLRRLTRRPRLRVLPRADAACAPGATTVQLEAGELLSATISSGPVRTTLQLPLDIGSAGIVADTIAGAVAEMAGCAGQGGGDPAGRARELLLRARLLVQRSFSEGPHAIALLEEAHALAPDDARIAVTLAMLRARFGVLGGGDFTGQDALVRAALAAAPGLAEAHLAAGHLELHTGEPEIATGHYRRAIACSPYLAEAHEALGRMLIEAGFLDVAMDRLNDALAIAPHLIAARWEIARAHALEGDWAASEAQEAELAKHPDHSLVRMSIIRMRIAWWRGDLRAMAAAFDDLGEIRTFEPPLLDRLHAVVFEGAWATHRDAIIAQVMSSRVPSKRWRAFLAQLGAEMAGHGGDAPACVAMLDQAVANGLFDLHWIERCPLLEPARRASASAPARARVKARAEAILDAMYGDGEAASDTIGA